MRRSLIIAKAAVLFAAESRAAEVDVTAPESVVRRAPFDVAPEDVAPEVGVGAPNSSRRNLLETWDEQG